MTPGYQRPHMGNVKGHKVMVLGSVLWLLVVFPCLISSLICPQGKQFLDTERQRCANCTICDNKHGFVLLRPCEVHRDTICGTIKELSLDLKPYHDLRHSHHRHYNARIPSKSDDEKTDERVVQEKEKKFNERLPFESEVTSTEVAFSSAETLVWDWQAIALTFAIFMCILFFLVIALYSLHQAKQWRRLKENFEADVEELSVKLSLMAAASSEKGETLESDLVQIRDGNYLKNHCVYLEQLLNVRKDTKVISDKKGNVYIEEANPTSIGIGVSSGKT